MQDLAKIQSCSIHSPPRLRTGLPRKSIFRIVIFSKIFAKQDKDLLCTLMLSIARSCCLFLQISLASRLPNRWMGKHLRTVFRAASRQQRTGKARHQFKHKHTKQISTENHP